MPIDPCRMLCGRIRRGVLSLPCPVTEPKPPYNGGALPMAKSTRVYTAQLIPHPPTHNRRHTLTGTHTHTQAHTHATQLAPLSRRYLFFHPQNYVSTWFGVRDWFAKVVHFPRLQLRMMERFSYFDQVRLHPPARASTPSTEPAASS